MLDEQIRRAVDVVLVHWRLAGSEQRIVSGFPTAAMDDSGPRRRARPPGSLRIEDLVRPGEHYLALGFQIRREITRLPPLR